MAFDPKNRALLERLTGATLTADRVEDEVSTLALQIAEAEARQNAAQETLTKRDRREAEELARHLDEQRALEDAAAALARLRAQESAEQAAQERARIQGVLDEWESTGALTDLVKRGIKGHAIQNVAGDAVLAAQSVWRTRFSTEPPPYEAWDVEGPFQASVLIFGGKIRCSCDARPGLDSPIIIWSGVDRPITGVGALIVHSIDNVGLHLADYPDDLPLFGVKPEDAPEQASDFDIAQFGMSA